MLEYGVYIELPVTLDVSFECYFFDLPLNFKRVCRCSVVCSKIRILVLFPDSVLALFLLWY